MVQDKIAVVTGANRGIGFEICKQLAQKKIKVILTARDEAKGKAAVQKLVKEGLDAVFYQLNVSDATSVKNLADRIQKELGRLDILINNAGIFIDPGKLAQNVELDIVRKTLEINLLGPLSLCQTFIPLMKKHNYGRIVNLSSGMGAFNEMGGGNASYRISKTSLNSMSVILASELRGSNILVNAMCPGWVRTDMGGKNATRSVERGADTAIWLATLPDNGPSGKFFRDRKEIPW